jgi:hypothetical protein
MAEKIIELCLNPQRRRKQVRAAFNANEKVASPVMVKRFQDTIINLLK